MGDHLGYWLIVLTHGVPNRLGEIETLHTGAALGHGRIANNVTGFGYVWNDATKSS